MTINYIITNALDANIPGLAEFWIIISHYCTGIIFLRRLPSSRGVQVDSECYTPRPFIIVTGYSQNEPWKIFAFNLVPPNLVCLLKTFMQCSLTPPPVLLYLQLIKTRLCLLAITPDWWEVLKSKHRFALSLSHLLINIFIYKFHHVRIVIWSQAYLLYFGRQDSSQIVLLLFCLLCREDVIIWMFGTSINGDCLVLFRPVKF